MKRQYLFHSFWSSLAVALLTTYSVEAKPVPVTGVKLNPAVSGIRVKPLKAKSLRVNATKKAHRHVKKLVRSPQGSSVDLMTRSHTPIGTTQIDLLSNHLLTQAGQQPKAAQPTIRLQQLLRQRSSPTNAELGRRSTPPPAYLNPSPNPLQFPTRPEEVQILGVQPITLQQAFELARRNNRELQIAQLNLERSRAALREALAAEFPRLGLDTRVTNSGRYIFSNEPAVPFDQNNDSTGLTGNLSLIYDLYTSGARRASIRSAEEQVRFDQLDFERELQEIRLDVATDYYNLQQADEQVRISQSAVNNAQASLRDAQALEQAGVGTRFAVLQAQVQLAQATQDLTNALSQQRIARRQLATRLSLAESVITSTADPVEIAGLWNLTLEESIVGAYRNRAELEQFLAQRNINQQRRRIALANLGPQVSLSANYNLSDTFDDDQNFNDAYSVGANLSLNLFDGGAARARARQAEANIAIAETSFANQRNQIRFEVEQAYSNLQSNLENIQTASIALEQAREALRLARLRFQAGVGTQTEVIDAEDDLTQAEGARVNAILSYNRALANLQRSVSSGQPR